MASSHAAQLIENITISTATTGLYDANGNKLDTVDITAQGGGVGYSRPMLLSPKSVDHIMTAICDGCVLTVELEMSPDNVNWCPCTLSDGNPCTVLCTSTAGDCTTKVVDVSVLQFVRVKLSGAGSEGGSCTVRLHFSLN